MITVLPSMIFFNFVVLSDRLQSYKRVLKNPIFMLLEIQYVSVYISVGGYFAFLPKYITTQFGIPLYTANYLLGKSYASLINIFPVQNEK